jgi:hypothetical protein
MLERLLEDVKSPIHLTPMTRDPVVASEWLSRFEGAGLDGVIVKPEDGVYEPGKRAMIKVKHARTADCVVAGFRWHKAGKNELVGSLLLGLYDADGRLHHVGVTSSFTMARRKGSRRSWRRRSNARWTSIRGVVGEAFGGEMTRMPGGQSRWSAGRSVVGPLRISACAVNKPHAGAAVPARGRVQRGGSTNSRRLRRYDQLEVAAPYELARSSVPGSRIDVGPFVRRLVGIERFLRRAQRLRHVLQVDADAGPGAKASAHGVDEDVGRLQVRSRLRVARLPSFEAGERVFFFRRAADLDQRMFPPSLLELRRTRGRAPL